MKTYFLILKLCRSLLSQEADQPPQQRDSSSAQLGVRISILSLWSGPSSNSSLSSSFREVKQGRFLRILINLARIWRKFLKISNLKEGLKNDFFPSGIGGKGCFTILYFNLKIVFGKLVIGEFHLNNLLEVLCYFHCLLLPLKKSYFNENFVVLSVIFQHACLKRISRHYQNPTSTNPQCLKLLNQFPQPVLLSWPVTTEQWTVLYRAEHQASCWEMLQRTQICISFR